MLTEDENNRIDYPVVTVGALIVAPDGEILLIRSNKWRNLYSIPEGEIASGETLQAAITREIWNETQLKVKKLRKALIQECIDSPEYYQKAHLIQHHFVAELDDAFSKHIKGADFLWISPVQALALPLSRACRLLLEWHLDNATEISSQAPGLIGFNRHRIDCIVGLYPVEREKVQTLYVDVKVKVDLTACVHSGKISDTIDYASLADACTDLALKKHYYLLETFAADVLEYCKNCFQPKWAWVQIQKPAAIPSAAHAFVEMEYQKKDHLLCGR